LPVVFLALTHHPVYNKNREVIASALTTVDLHDLARVAATYGLDGFYVVQPLDDQRRLAADMIAHWQSGPGGAYNRDRAEAMALARLTASLAEAKDDIARRCGRPPLAVATTAISRPGAISYSAVRQTWTDGRPVLIVFGTAWGLADQAMAECDACLAPIVGPGDYNHLSVRSAAGIIIDRLLGRSDDDANQGR
jgi:hypothetical protein